jgi:hypothetical protein
LNWYFSKRLLGINLNNIYKKNNIMKHTKLKDLLFEMRCPAGMKYDPILGNCVIDNWTELPTIMIYGFKNDPDGSVKKSYDAYHNSYSKLNALYQQNKKEVPAELNYETFKDRVTASAELFTNLKNKIDSLYNKVYHDFSLPSRNRFIENDVKTMVGKPYVWGKMGPEFFDCSGLVCSVFELGSKHNAQMLYDKFTHIPENELLPGDLIFFDYQLPNIKTNDDGIDMVKTKAGNNIPYNTKISHVAIISNIDDKGNITMIHASGGEHACSVELYQEAKENGTMDRYKKKCSVKEARYTNNWRKNTKAFARYIGYNFI